MLQTPWDGCCGKQRGGSFPLPHVFVFCFVFAVENSSLALVWGESKGIVSLEDRICLSFPLCRGLFLLELLPTFDFVFFFLFFVFFFIFVFWFLPFVFCILFFWRRPPIFPISSQGRVYCTLASPSLLKGGDEFRFWEIQLPVRKLPHPLST